MNKIKKIVNNKYFIIGLITLFIITIGITGTYAWLTWSSPNTTEMTITIGNIADVIFDNGQDIYTTNLSPVFYPEAGEKSNFSIVKRSTAASANITYTVTLDITTIAEELKSASFKYKLINNTSSTEVASGDFSGTSNGSTLTLYTGILTDTRADYTFLIYIDSNIENNTNMMGKKFSATLNITASNSQTLTETITYLYTNASKSTVTNNGINYNIAPSVRLMSDRLGGTTTDLEGGNVRYYGNPQSEIVPAWQSDRTSILANGLFGSPFTSESNCSSMLTALTTCSANYSALGFSSASECEAGLPALLKSMANVSTVSELITEYCTNDTYPLNNYIYFNCSDYSNQSSSTCETWRIIGIFDGKVKIMRNNTIGKLAWDYDKNDNSSLTTYDNNWHTATLQKLLNNSYYNGTGTITYYNSNSANNSVSLNMNNIGIKNTATRNMISETNWYLGGWNTSDSYSNQIYQYERGTQKCSGCTYETIWKGNIALPYPSDYSYSSDFSICTNTIGGYNNNVCFGTNWMYPIMSADGTQSSWLLTPNSSNSNRAWDVISVGSVHVGYYSGNGFGVAPVLYLSSELSLSGGVGSSADPYRLSSS